MKISSAIVTLGALAPLASAVDMTNFLDRGCTGGALIYRNVAARTCCPGVFIINGRPVGSESTRFVNLPGGAQVALWLSSRDRTCGVAKAAFRTGGSICGNAQAGTGEYAGSSWDRPVGAKRQVQSSATGNEVDVVEIKGSKGAAGAKECTSTAEPDVVRLAEGQEYELSGLTPDKTEELIALAYNGAKSDDLPEEFAQLQSK